MKPSKRPPIATKAMALAAVGSMCRHCGGSPIQFCHARPTSLRGRGRGSKARYKDVVKFPDRYIPLCEECHWKFDHPLLATHGQHSTVNPQDNTAGV